MHRVSEGLMAIVASVVLCIGLAACGNADSGSSASTSQSNGMAKYSGDTVMSTAFRQGSHIWLLSGVPNPDAVINLNKVMESGNSLYIDAVMNRIFDDSTTLLEAARVARERMRMQLITTGEIALSSNGQAYDYDYGLDSTTQKVNASTAWTSTSADIVGDIRKWQDDIEDSTGIRPNRAVCSI